MRTLHFSKTLTVTTDSAETYMRRFHLNRLYISAAFLFAASAVFPQTPSVVEHIRIPLWAELDAYPGLAEAGNTSATGIFDYPVSRIRQLAPFLISGMVHGWEFSYTPSDKMRNVEEYFEFSDIQPLGDEEKNISYSDPWIEDGKVSCWTEFTRTTQMIRDYNLWSSITNPKIAGIGYGKIEDGFDGIREAVQDAVKNAIRSYYRTRIRNKPKEIRGKVLVRSEPLIGIDQGRYKVQLDFFMESGRIIPYTQY